MSFNKSLLLNFIAVINHHKRIGIKLSKISKTKFIVSGQLRKVQSEKKWVKDNIKVKYAKGFAQATYVQQRENKLKLAIWII